MPSFTAPTTKSVGQTMSQILGRMFSFLSLISPLTIEVTRAGMVDSAGAGVVSVVISFACLQRKASSRARVKNETRAGFLIFGEYEVDWEFVSNDGGDSAPMRCCFGCDCVRSK